MTMERIQGNGEHVLVVDDDQTVRSMVLNMLDCLGYSGAAVASGEEAVRYLERKPAHLVMLDMQMSPGINGREAYEKILDISPGQRAILVSGYAEAREINRALELGVSRFVEKPFTLYELGSAIQTALHGSEER
jgi:CheY-like chemotaxis protein